MHLPTHVTCRFVLAIFKTALYMDKFLSSGCTALVHHHWISCKASSSHQDANQSKDISQEELITFANYILCQQKLAIYCSCHLSFVFVLFLYLWVFSGIEFINIAVTGLLKASYLLNYSSLQKIFCCCSYGPLPQTILDCNA